jgi:hypothetical protein
VNLYFTIPVCPLQNSSNSTLSQNFPCRLLSKRRYSNFTTYSLLASMTFVYLRIYSIILLFLYINTRVLYQYASGNVASTMLEKPWGLSCEVPHLYLVHHRDPSPVDLGLFCDHHYTLSLPPLFTIDFSVPIKHPPPPPLALDPSSSFV